MYINTETLQYPLTDIQIRLENPNKSYSAAFFPEEPYSWVFETPKPTYNPITHYLLEDVPVKTEMGHWEQCWKLVEYTPEQIAKNELDNYKASIPKSVSPRQIRQALTQVGLRTLVEQTISNGDQDLKDWWEFSTTFERNHPQVIAMGIVLNQSEETLDNLWRLAGTL